MGSHGDQIDSQPAGGVVDDVGWKSVIDMDLDLGPGPAQWFGEGFEAGQGLGRALACTSGQMRLGPGVDDLGMKSVHMQQMDLRSGTRRSE